MIDRRTMIIFCWLVMITGMAIGSGLMYLSDRRELREAYTQRARCEETLIRQGEK